MNIIIPLAGLGTRFSSQGIEVPKPLFRVNGKTLIEHSVESLDIPGRYIFITRKYSNPDYNKELSSILNSFGKNIIEIQLDRDQRGAADAVLSAKEYINNDEELITTNCDQILQWNGQMFLNTINIEAAGAVVLYKSTDPKNSYAKIENGRVVDIVEKEVISDDALVGVHYWKHGKDFVSSAEKLLIDKKDKECYISETYKYLIQDNKFVDYYTISSNRYICLGTPEHIKEYLEKINESI